MYITVRTIISNGGEIDTAVKVYYDYETARTNLMMQKDILLLELLIKYTDGISKIDDFNINKYGTFKYEDDLLEFIEDGGNYMIRYEIKCPENYKQDYDLLRKEFGIGLGLL
jgi:hypothetical protein